MVPSRNSSDKLIALLQLAYSGERAAAYAYRGHWQSVSDQHERDSIRSIEEDEWRHRQLVGEMLAGLGAEPNHRREVRATIIGRTLGLLCHVTGWLAPMYGAGKLESRNVKEYETAARLARDCGCVNLIDCLLEMAEVEWDHESIFALASSVTGSAESFLCGHHHRQGKPFACRTKVKSASPLNRNRHECSNPQRWRGKQKFRWA
jgi:rubrerythrin